MKKKSTSQSTPARRSLGKGGFLNIRVLLGLVVAVTGVCMALIGFSAFSNASAQPNAGRAENQEQFGQTTVIHPTHSDLSRPLREQPMVWPPIEAEHEANPNPKLPLQHQDGPDPVIQNSFWQRLIN